MKITFYGVRGIFPPGAQTSCILIEANGKTFVVDLGSTDLFEDRDVVQQVDLVLLTHQHNDHIAQLPRMIEQRPDCRFVAPERVEGGNQLEDLPSEWCGLTLETFVTNHPKKNFAYKLSDQSGCIVITGDCAYEPALAEFCRGVDVVICEASRKESHRTDALRQGHMCPSLFARLMTEAAPSLAVATHFVELEPPEFLSEVQKELLPGIQLVAAGEGLELTL